MTTSDDRQVYVRPDLLYLDRKRVYLADEKAYEVSPQDAALLELVYRGDADFARLCSSVVAHGGGKSEAEVRSALEIGLSDSRSILELRNCSGPSAPEVIVCDFSPSGQLVDAQRITKRLRTTHRVVHLGIEARLKGKWPDDVSYARAKKEGAVGSWFEFTQWCRAFIMRHADALLVLTGEQDAILFGDLTARTRSVVLAPPSWPPRTGLADVGFEDLADKDPFPAVRDLFYAMRFTEDDDFSAFSRKHMTSFAWLENHALANAGAVAYAAIDQAGLLRNMRGGAHRERFVLGERGRRRPSQDGARNRLRVVLSLEQGLDPVLPLFAILRQLLDSELIESLEVQTPDGKFVVGFTDTSVSLTAIGDQRNADLIGAIVIPGLLRDCRPVYECHVDNVPCGFVATKRAHPLLDGLAEDAMLPPLSLASLTEWIQALRDDSGSLRQQLNQALSKRLAGTNVVDYLRELAGTATVNSGDRS